MDPISAFGIATGVISLIPLCAQGFNMITACFDAPKAVRESMTKITVQKILFINWGNPMGLQNVSDKIAVETLKKRIPNWDLIGPGVLQILTAMSDTFADVNTLEENYGLKPSKDFTQWKLEKRDSLKRPDVWKYKQMFKDREQRMGVLQRAKFVLADKDKFAALADMLFSYNYGLINVCPPALVQTIYNIMVPEILSSPAGQEDPGHVANVARKLAESNPGSIERGQRAGYNLLASAASFRAKVKDVQADKFDPLSMKDHVIRSSNWAIKDGENIIGTMAYRHSVSQPSNLRICYIEWKSYRSYKEQLDSELERDIESLAKVASIVNKPTEFRTLDCLGAFKDARNSRYGFVYMLPAYLWTVPEKDALNDDVFRRRKPSSLLSLIEATKRQIPEALDLGSRITLAKKLAQSLLVLQAAGWVHKNISSKSIIFFRDSSGLGSGPSTTGRIDFDHPYICGFGQSRPDYTAVKEGRPKSAGDEPVVENRMRTVVPRPLQEQRQVMRNFYQHPVKRLDPNIYYQSSFDLYSLGCVLVEIALWQPLSELTSGENEDPNDFRDRLLGVTRREMPGLVGRIYAEAARRCLEIKGKEGEDQEQKKGLCWKLIEELSKCVV